MVVVWKHGRRRDRVGVDFVDAVRDFVYRRAGIAHGCVHGRVQSLIVIPQIVMSLIVPRIFNNVLGGDPRNAVVLGGISLLVAAVTVLGVRDVHVHETV